MIQIKGIIGEGNNTLVSIIAQVQEEKGSIHVKIDSIGGDLDEGVSIYNYLRGLKNVTTECENNCASAASIIFLAGKKRVAGCPIMIHNPWTQAQGDSAELRNIAEFLSRKEQELEIIYASYTTVGEKVLSNLMDSETYISPSQAVSLGFATEAKQIALAKINIANISKTDFKQKTKQMAKGKKGSFLDFVTRWKGEKQRNRTMFYAMDLTTDDGTILTVDREEGDPQVGDTASPDGSHVIEGRVILVEDGVIVNIEGASNSANPLADITALLEEALTKIEELEGENEELKAQVRSNAKVLNTVNMAGGIEKLTRGIKSNYTPQARLNRAKASIGNPLVERLETLKSKRGIN